MILLYIVVRRPVKGFQARPWTGLRSRWIRGITLWNMVYRLILDITSMVGVLEFSDNLF